MPDSSWLPIAASLAGGGAAGALLTASVALYRNRRQPVGYRVDIEPVFQHSSAIAPFELTVNVDDGSAMLQFSNLFVATVDIVNRGNVDRQQFNLGFTLAETDESIFLDATPPDRHHAAVFGVVPVPRAPLREIDVTLKPFNRKDSFRFRIYMVMHAALPGPLNIGSPEPVVFKPMPTLVELAAAAARGAQLNIGPLRFTVFK